VFNYLPPPADLIEYAKSLYFRRCEGEIIPVEPIAINTWFPAESECHENAAILQNYSSKYKAIRGWLYMEDVGSGEYVRFASHSVVQIDGQRMVDITPRRILRDYPFLSANIDEQYYNSIVEKLAIVNGGYTFLDYWLEEGGI